MLHIKCYALTCLITLSAGSGEGAGVGLDLNLQKRTKNENPAENNCIKNIKALSKLWVETSSGASLCKVSFLLVISILKYMLWIQFNDHTQSVKVYLKDLLVLYGVLFENCLMHKKLCTQIEAANYPLKCLGCKTPPAEDLTSYKRDV